MIAAPFIRRRSLNTGFTLMELLVVIAILGVLLTLALVNFANVNRRSDVMNAAEDVSSLLREAQSQSMAVINEVGHGVYFDIVGQQVILFEETQYDPLSQSNVSTSLPASVSIASIVLTGGGNSVRFEPLTGETSNDGEVVLQSKNDSGIYATINISTQGKISTE